MVKRCCWGTCHGDERYKERLNGAWLVPFPNPRTNNGTKLNKCLRWIKACGRPHDKLNVDNLKRHRCVCSTHFVGGCGPTQQHPDPTQAELVPVEPKNPKKKCNNCPNDPPIIYVQLQAVPINELGATSTVEEAKKLNVNTVSTQTIDPCFSMIEVLKLNRELQQLQKQLKKKDQYINKLEECVNMKDISVKKVKKQQYLIKLGENVQLQSFNVKKDQYIHDLPFVPNVKEEISSDGKS